MFRDINQVKEFSKLTHWPLSWQPRGATVDREAEQSGAGKAAQGGDGQVTEARRQHLRLRPEDSQVRRGLCTGWLLLCFTLVVYQLQK